MRQTWQYDTSQNRTHNNLLWKLALKYASFDELTEELKLQFYREQFKRDATNKLRYSSGEPLMDAVAGAFIATIISIPFLASVGKGVEDAGPASLLFGVASFFVSRARVKKHQEARRRDEKHEKEEFLANANSGQIT